MCCLFASSWLVEITIRLMVSDCVKSSGKIPQYYYGLNYGGKVVTVQVCSSMYLIGKSL